MSLKYNAYRPTAQKYVQSRLISDETAEEEMTGKRHVSDTSYVTFMSLSQGKA